MTTSVLYYPPFGSSGDIRVVHETGHKLPINLIVPSRNRRVVDSIWINAGTVSEVVIR